MKKTEDIEIESMSDFEIELKKLEEKRAQLKREGTGNVSNFLFRGQSEQESKLETTLDRYADKGGMSMSEYYGRILHYKPQIETLTGEKWDIPSLEEYTAWLETLDVRKIQKPQAYDYMAYLRHHGFPSPLLDWTNSPYIAAFFAFDELAESEAAGSEDTGHVAIYAYLEFTGRGKSTLNPSPWIATFGPNVKTHRRHFLQQSRYTVCVRIKEKEALYASHEDAIISGEERQDRIWKFIIPKKERLLWLKKLYSMNISAYSLFGSEESLMRTIALRAFKL